MTTSTLARKSDPYTSDLAAVALANRTTQMDALLAVYCKAYPNALIAAEATSKVGLGDGGWKRVSDLKNAGYIAPVLDAGNRAITQPGPNGRQCMVLRATDRGLSVGGSNL